VSFTKTIVPIGGSNREKVLDGVFSFIIYISSLVLYSNFITLLPLSVPDEEFIASTK